MSRRPAELSLSDLDEDKFMLGLLETKLADTTFKTPAATPTDHIYENRGCLTVGSDSLTLSNVSYADSKKKKSKGELHTDLGLDVLTSSPCNADSLEELLDIYPHISNEFDSMKPVPHPTLKRYSATETIIMRVTQVSGLKVVVETADPDYEYESGNVFIDNFISYVYDRRPQVKETIHTEPIDPDTIHLLGILTYRLALKTTRGDSLSRIRHLIAAMLLVKMAGNNDDADFVRTSWTIRRPSYSSPKAHRPQPCRASAPHPNP